MRPRVLLHLNGLVIFLGSLFFYIDRGHTLAAPGVVVALGFLADIRVLLLIGAVWAAHIGMDIAFGYGLKYRTGFKETHMQSV